MSKSKIQNKSQIRHFGFYLATSLLLCLCLCGCATKRQAAAGQVLPMVTSDAEVFILAERALRGVFPPQYRATHRAIITVRQQQFVCDGWIEVSPAEGWHLALVSALGLITDVRVKANGESEVLKVTPLFREDWSREHVVTALRWLFAPPPPLAPAGRRGDSRLALEGAEAADDAQARYVCSADGRRWEELEVRTGSRRVFHARFREYRRFAGFEGEIPTDIELAAKTHTLHLRIVALTTTGGPATEAVR